MKVTVHHFKVYDVRTDQEIMPPLKSSEERIKGIAGAVIIPGTAEVVGSEMLDAYGRYDPEKSDAQRP